MYARRRRAYFLLMGGCLVLFVSAWALVRLWSVPVAVGMCVVAMVIPPIAAMIANRRGPDDRWWDDPSGDPQSDEWWDELDGKRRPGDSAAERERERRRREEHGDDGPY
ncbi:DUF3099 domain-containing protein [Streptomyces sp. NPDC006798]|uniref:DUF3099 domain-containing protein n=1 Tax=Streptomyces sp. NPDC006798 TaxID=3155462 RepID=UPI0034104B1F